MNGLARLCLAAAMGLSIPLHAFGWGSVTGPHGGTATTGPRGAGYAQGPNGATALSRPEGRRLRTRSQRRDGLPRSSGCRCRLRPEWRHGVSRPLWWSCCDRSLWWDCLPGTVRGPCSLRHQRGLCWRGSQAVGCGALLRIGRRGGDVGNDRGCHDTAASAVAGALLVLVQPGAYARVLGLLWLTGSWLVLVRSQ